MPTKRKPQTQSDYVSDRVFDGVKKLTPARAAQLRAGYLKQKEQPKPAKPTEKAAGTTGKPARG